jgi:hypothetical protein
VLGLLRRKYGLYYLIQGGMLLLTSQDEVEAEKNLVRMVYPVGDLVTDEDGEEDYDSLINAITKTVEPSMWRELQRVRQVVPIAAFQVISPASSYVSAPAAQPPSTPPANATNQSGGMGGMVGGAGGPGTVVVVENSQSLVIAQTRDVHAKIQDLLRSLRIARKIADDAADSD